MGIGVDDIFIFYDMFMARRRMPAAQRMWHSWKQASFATFVTSMSTVAAFFFNLWTTIPALRFFSVFMCLMVGVNYVFVCIWFPFVLQLWSEAAFLNRWSAALKRLCPLTFSLPGLIKIFKPRTWSSDPSFRFFEAFFHFTWHPLLLRFRIPLVVGFAAVFICSAVFASQLSATQTPPQFFPDSTNVALLLLQVQKFINWQQSSYFADSATSYQAPPPPPPSAQVCRLMPSCTVCHNIGCTWCELTGVHFCDADASSCRSISGTAFDITETCPISNFCQDRYSNCTSCIGSGDCGWCPNDFHSVCLPQTTTGMNN